MQIPQFIESLLYIIIILTFFIGCGTAATIWLLREAKLLKRIPVD